MHEKLSYCVIRHSCERQEYFIGGVGGDQLFSIFKLGASLYLFWLNITYSYTWLAWYLLNHFLLGLCTYSL